ncbi:TetR/AcrR family transcriptional regulator [Phycicoccus endophyticus]|uniref:TetR/AcrR family transcriptional regulator n=1 Tax=Phycicoccus endophyticus TaxID=1690220 RepID=A0A7G9QYU3_9MICO|nr:TetR/AcrR family transcriptional regulator [Phycicoccus endophyticus]NHI20437.1 TetR/AcrR family transcriptional regulator [Phycicoccus endophyticus]QNN48518.1 TetR/AcrR family transcriptional regulator [Phycicoccus endophyticus]GGL30799.1 TetR family transcriptional regulator [Phycicoccus endophyticus]
MSSSTTTPRSTRLPRSERRAQLLEAAQAVFVQSGYHAAAMDEIAERAGVSKPVLYQHFPGKLDLYLALLDTHCETLEQLVRHALERTEGDNEVRVRATVAAYFDFVTREDAAFRMVFESDLTSVPQVRGRLDAVEMACAEAISEVIALDTGVDEERALLLGSALAGMAQVAARHWLAQDGELPEADAAATISMLAWRGLGSFPKVAG